MWTLVLWLIVALGMVYYTVSRYRSIASPPLYVYAQPSKGQFLHFNEAKGSYEISMSLNGACVFTQAKALALVKDRPDLKLLDWTLFNIQSGKSRNVD
jgi:hypothetical protein